MWVLMQWAWSVGHMTKGALYKSCALPFSIIFVSTVMQVESRKRLIHTRHCKYTQVWCLGQLCGNEARVFPSNRGGSGTCVNEITGYHDCYRCIALLNKYYGHRCYRICFAHEELQHQNDDI